MGLGGTPEKRHETYPLYEQRRINKRVKNAKKNRTDALYSSLQSISSNGWVVEDHYERKRKTDQVVGSRNVDGNLKETFSQNLSVKYGLK